VPVRLGRRQGESVTSTQSVSWEGRQTRTPPAAGIARAAGDAGCVQGDWLASGAVPCPHGARDPGHTARASLPPAPAAEPGRPGRAGAATCVRCWLRKGSCGGSFPGAQPRRKESSVAPYTRVCRAGSHPPAGHETRLLGHHSRENDNVRTCNTQKGDVLSSNLCFSRTCVGTGSSWESRSRCGFLSSTCWDGHRTQPRAPRSQET